MLSIFKSFETAFFLQANFLEAGAQMLSRTEAPL